MGGEAASGSAFAHGRERRTRIRCLADEQDSFHTDFRQSIL